MEDVLVPIVALDIAIVRAPPHPFRFRRQVPFARVAVGDQPRLDLGLTVVRAIIRPADNDRPAATAWASGLAEPGPAPSEALITPPPHNSLAGGDPVEAGLSPASTSRAAMPPVRPSWASRS
jgi:hypothetical protein